MADCLLLSYIGQLRHCHHRIINYFTGIKLMIRRLGKKVGIRGIHIHRLRHTFAISFLRAIGDVFTLQYLLGHSTLAMIQRYSQVLNADDAMKAHKKFSPLANLGLK